MLYKILIILPQLCTACFVCLLIHGLTIDYLGFRKRAINQALMTRQYLKSEQTDGQKDTRTYGQTDGHFDLQKASAQRADALKINKETKIKKKTKTNRDTKIKKRKVGKVWFKQTCLKRQVQNDGLKQTSLNARVKIDGSKQTGPNIRVQKDRFKKLGQTYRSKKKYIYIYM